jgi:2-polyprenyl-3-methyl-5-hydroxy-6-metoxy-1,4-benzoquinol methylase
MNKSTAKKMTEIKDHFEEIATDYDYYKKKAWYYYDWLKKICVIHTPNIRRKRLLELGCGTGDVLDYLKPKFGLGIDISKRMVDIAKKKHNSKNLKFEIGAGETLDVKRLQKGRFDYILMPDVIEHLADVEKTFANVSSIMHKDSKFIITMINPLWEPIFMIGEKLKYKMPEGPHNRISYRKIKAIAARKGMKISRRNFYVLAPIYIPFVSNPVNFIFNRIPLVRMLGLVEVLVLTKI